MSGTSRVIRLGAVLLGLSIVIVPAKAHGQGFGPLGNRFGGFAPLGLGGFQAGPFGNTRIISSQAPVLSVFNGQTSLMQIQPFQWFPTNVQVVQAGGQVAFVPQYQPIPQGLNFPVQAVATPNGIVRVSAAPVFVNAGPGPLFPITTFITPTFAGGAQGSPVPFTQFIQGPGLTTVFPSTTVGVPFGGQAFLGGYGRSGFGRNAFGPPILGGVPFFRPGFRNFNFGGNMNFFPVGAPRIFVP